MKSHLYVTSSSSCRYLDCKFSGMTLKHCVKHLTVGDAHILTRVVKTSHHSCNAQVPADREIFFLFKKHLLRIQSVRDRYIKYDYGTLVEWYSLHGADCLEKLTGSQPVKKLPAFYGIGRFITALTSARHLSLSWARSNQSMPPSHFLNIHLNFILSSTPRSSKWSLSLIFPYQNPPLPHTRYTTRQSHTSRFDHPNCIWWAVNIVKLHIIIFFSIPLLPHYVTRN